MPKTQDAKVVLMCCDLQKALLAADETTFLTGNSGVSDELADFSTYLQIHDVAKLYPF